MNKKKNILFLTISRVNDINQRGIYTDLMREFRNRGNRVVIVTPTERKFNQSTSITEVDGIVVLKVWTLNLQKCNIIEKGIGSLLMEYQFSWAIHKFLSGIKFDLILYSTPPITYSGLVRSLKKRTGALTYLMLKDIFPQNAVDLGMMRRGGVIHQYFRRKERLLYKISDHIGCMSPANVEYIQNHNPELNQSNIEICPNSIELVDSEPLDVKVRNKVRNAHGIPENSVVFLYGGNLGKPQGIDFLLEILKSNNNKSDRFFVIIGDGTEYQRIKAWFDTYKPSNAILLSLLPKKEYDLLVKACDIGLVFLDPRFTIPNYPSRLLSYLENRMPVLMATDTTTDIGRIAEHNGYGLWCINGDLESFNSHVDQLVENRSLMIQMGNCGYNFLIENYLVKQTCDIIIGHL